jgi:hypothetical protein
MSKIWDALKAVERRQVSQAWQGRPQWGFHPTYDRRCGVRLHTCVPMFVYGHSTAVGAFYESAELQFINARGGLLTLPIAVSCGQKLLLTRKNTETDQQCCVIGLRSNSMDAFAIAVQFLEPLADLLTNKE